VFPRISEAFRIDLSSDHDSAISLVQTLRPDFIVNPAAISAVPSCQSNLDAARRVNDPSDIAQAAVSCGCSRFIHFWTDIVYRGSHGEY
jgi:dTDP-4-dehydrorhamnose reductase